MSVHLNVQARHLERGAYLYIRQSSMRQVLENTESAAGFANSRTAIPVSAGHAFR